MGSIGIVLKGMIEPPHDKTNKMACAPSEDSDQPGRTCHFVGFVMSHEAAHIIHD